MRIDPRAPIAGFSPAQIRRLIVRSPGGMITPGDAAYEFKIDESRASRLLLDLVDDGWLAYHGDGRFLVTDQGHRLAATRFIKRFPIERGRAIVARVTETARAINSEPHNAWRITHIYLFGSVLTGKDGDDVGDVDLVVLTDLRGDIDVDSLAQLRAEESYETPARLLRGVSGSANAASWGDTKIRRKLRRTASGRIAMHGPDDLDLSMPRQLVYRFDADSGVEIDPAKTGELERPVEHKSDDRARSGEIMWQIRRDFERSLAEDEESEDV